MTNRMNRRTALGRLVAAGASLAGLAAPAAAAPAEAPIEASAEPLDPIFAAIENHKAALAEYSGSINAVDKVWAEQNGYETTEADRERNDAASDAERDALDELANTSPTTLAGFRAIFTYFIECDVSLIDGDEVNDFFQSFLDSPLLALEPA